MLGHERAMLEAAGHEVALHTVGNDAISGLSGRIDAFWNAPWNTASQQRFAEALQAERPDLVHVHNTFPLLTPAIYQACADAGAPVVQTLHNYRPVCVNGFLVRDGAPCEKCLVGSGAWAIAHRCYRGSLPGSLAAARVIWSNRRKQVWTRLVSRFIVLSEQAREVFVQAGFPAERISVKPNFMPGPGPPSVHGERAGALFVGRLSAEKGVTELVETWRNIRDMPLRIIGDGPLLEPLRAIAPAHVELTGRLPADLVRKAMEEAQVLIAPSVGREPFGLVVIEAFAAGAPVIAANRGALGEIVEDGVTGRLFDPDDPASLPDLARWAAGRPDRLAAMGAAARQVYETRYTPEADLPRLEAIYAQALSEGRP